MGRKRIDVKKSNDGNRLFKRALAKFEAEQNLTQLCLKGEQPFFASSCNESQKKIQIVFQSGTVVD